MKISKRIICLIICFSFLIFLASCNGVINISIDDNTTSQSEHSSSSSETSETSLESSTNESIESTAKDTYIVTFKDENETTLFSLECNKGEIPSYNGQIPTKVSTSEYSYEFDGWYTSKEGGNKVTTFPEVNSSVTYYARFKKTKNKYTVVWKNYDETILETDSNLEYGVMPEYNGSTPIKQSDQNNNYRFNGWDKIVSTVTGNIEYIAVYEAVPKSLCIVNFNSNGGTPITSQGIIKGEKATKPANPTKEGYTFDDWYYQGERWSFIGYTVTENMTLEAHWNINSYNLSLSMNNSKAGSVSSNSGAHNYNESITITATTNAGYTFNGWFNGDDLVSPLETYTFYMPASNLSYIAKWTANTNTQYKVEHYLQNLDDDNYPELPYETDSLTGTTDTLTNGEVKTYEGFTSPSITQVNINGDGTTVIKLFYTRNSYTIALNLNNGNAGTITGAGTYKYGKEIIISATTNPEYTFNGWYINDEEYTTDSSFDYEVVASNVTFEARYTPNKYKITIDNQAEGVTISGITSGNSYDYNTAITLTATNVSSDKKLVWYFNDIAVAYGNSYSFYVQSKDITIKLILADTLNDIAYTKDENKIYFGTYPQTKVTDNTLISELNTLAGSLPTSSNKANWTDYNYYISSSVTSFMYYQDIDYDNNGTYDYRGVYFTQYRPPWCSESTSTNISFQDDNGYRTNTIYWFSYDSIEWDILSESNGKALIISNLILDSQDYYPVDSTLTFSHNGGTGYANNYELSNIRKWLNDNFYNTAFNDLQKALIETTTVDNSVASTGQSSNSYVCNNTNDKMFLFSLNEATTYYSNTTARTAKGSDYAKCQGLYVYSSNGNSNWGLRSPYRNSAYCAYIVDCDGDISYYIVHQTIHGVRPACWVTL